MDKERGFTLRCLLEEWKSLAESDRNDDIWASLKENFLFVTAIGALSLATKFYHDKPFTICLLSTGLLLLIYNFLAIEGINIHQFARRERLKQIEAIMPMKFYIKQNELMKGVRRSWFFKDVGPLRFLRFFMIILGLVYSIWIYGILDNWWL